MKVKGVKCGRFEVVAGMHFRHVRVGGIGLGTYEIVRDKGMLLLFDKIDSSK